MKPLSFLGIVAGRPSGVFRKRHGEKPAISSTRYRADWIRTTGSRCRGSGVREVRIRDQAGAFGVFYVAIRPEAVYVLHAFQKKTQVTAKRDLARAEARLKELIRSGP